MLFLLQTGEKEYLPFLFYNCTSASGPLDSTVQGRIARLMTDFIAEVAHEMALEPPLPGLDYPF